MTAMATPSCSQDWRQNQDKNAACTLCKLVSYHKRILRIVITEQEPDIRLQLIELDIMEGVVKLCKENTVNFRRLGDKLSQIFLSAQADSTSIQLPTTCSEKLSDFHFSCWCIPTRSYTLQHDEGNCPKKNKILEPFICRLSENLGLSEYVFESTIEHVITSSEQVLLEIDYNKLIQITREPKQIIEIIIQNTFYRSRSNPNEPGTSKSTSKNCTFKPMSSARSAPPDRSRSAPPDRSRSAPPDRSRSAPPDRSRSAPPDRSRSAPPDRFKDDDWFEAVDRGRVVRYYSPPDVARFKNFDTVKILLYKCIHGVESHMINYFSWYFNEHFTHGLFNPCLPYLSYRRYLEYQKTEEITNPNVIIVEDNPLELNTNFAYVLARNFYVHHTYVKKYIQENGLLCKCIIPRNKEIPFVIRSLNPINGKHLFHMIYKNNNHSKSSYENVFETLVILRDAMHRLRLNQISMCKIGSSNTCFGYQELYFGEILKMIEYVFLGTDIKILIGLNTMKCWNFRSLFSKNHGQSSEQVDFSLERTYRFAPCEEIGSDEEEDRFTDDEE